MQIYSFQWTCSFSKLIIYEPQNKPIDRLTKWMENAMDQKFR